MLPVAYRLHKETEIKSLIRQGQTFFLPEFIIKYQKTKEKPSKIAFVVSTKVDKKAVARNRIKRQMREAIKDLLPDIKDGYSILVIARKKALELDFATITKQFKFALAKIGVYAGK
ncbi:ribonuclease P protein component [bacterium]|jgi:ribonuclease P protein component|nr:ribonuclease P protein component [bacterium]MBT4649197.1 ribonuclease P protein component [bacterium]